MKKINLEEIIKEGLKELKERKELEEKTRDSDFDGITDKEEKEKYNTDPYTIDTDGDGDFITGTISKINFLIINLKYKFYVRRKNAGQYNSKSSKRSSKGS